MCPKNSGKNIFQAIIKFGHFLGKNRVKFGIFANFRANINNLGILLIFWA